MKGVVEQINDSESSGGYLCFIKNCGKSSIPNDLILDAAMSSSMNDEEYTMLFLRGKEFTVQGTIGKEKHRVISIRTTHKEHKIKKR